MSWTSRARSNNPPAAPPPLPIAAPAAGAPGGRVYPPGDSGTPGGTDLSALPDVAGKISEPLSKTEKIVIINSGKSLHVTIRRRSLGRALGEYGGDVFE